MAQRYFPEVNAFTAGELSPRMRGRTDTQQYFQGCTTLQNCINYVHGGATKRPGTKYIATAKDSTKPVRLIPFRYSTTQAYILEFGHEYMRVYKDGGIVTVTGTPYFIATPYDGYDLANLYYTQSADTMYLAHPDYAPRKLTRTGHSSWTLEEVTFTWGPFLDDNDTATTITPTATSGTVTLTASAATFDSDHVGAQWKIGNSLLESTTVSGENTWTSNVAVDTGETLVAAATCTGTWGSTTVTLQKTYDAGTTWVDVVEFTSNNSLEVAETVGDVHYSIGVKTGDFDTNLVDVSITLLDQSGYVTIDAVTNSTTATGTVVETLPATTATTDWAEGAWSTYRGYPGTVCFFEQRLVWGGSTYRPSTVWASKVDDYENHDAGTGLDDDAYIYTLVTNEVNTIRWMVPADILRIGTAGGQHKFGYTNEPTTPTNVHTKLHSTIGAAAVRPVLVNGVVLFIQENGRKLRAMSWDDDTQQYVAPEISAKAEHLLNYTTGITEMAWTLSPDPILWMVRFTDGALIGCTYDSYEGVIAYHEHTTVGYFESVAAIPGSDRDELWCVAYRENNSGAFRSIEQFVTTNWNRDNQEEAVYLDSALTYSGTGSTTLSGLDHLEAQTVGVITEGGVHPDCTVSGGVVTLTYSTTQAHAGLNFTSTVESMPLNFPVQGSATPRRKSVHSVTVHVQDTNYSKIGYVSTDTDTVKYRNTTDLMDTAIPLYTGPKTLEFPYGYSEEVTVRVVSDVPLPFTVLSIAPTMSIGNI